MYHSIVKYWICNTVLPMHEGEQAIARETYGAFTSASSWVIVRGMIFIPYQQGLAVLFGVQNKKQEPMFGSMEPLAGFCWTKIQSPGCSLLTLLHSLEFWPF